MQNIKKFWMEPVITTAYEQPWGAFIRKIGLRAGVVGTTFHQGGTPASLPPSPLK